MRYFCSFLLTNENVYGILFMKGDKGMSLELALVYIGVILMYFIGYCIGYSKRTEQEFTEDWEINELTDEEVEKIINFFFEIKKGK